MYLGEAAFQDGRVDQEEFKIPVHIADRPEDHVILGMQSYLKR